MTNNTLAEALEPFAKEADTWADTVPDAYQPLMTEPGQKVPAYGANAVFTIGDLRRAKATLAALRASTDAAAEPVAWMYDHPDYARHGIAPFVQIERADPEKVKDGWIETPLGKIAHPTAAVAGEGVITEAQSVSLHNSLIASFDEFADPQPLSQPAAVAGEELVLGLRQAQYALRDYNSKQPDCGFDKLANACEIAANILSQPAGDALLLTIERKIGSYGAAFDPPGPCRAFTSEHQPGNLGAHSLGKAANEAMRHSAGDYIDRGLSLLKRLHENGFGVFEIDRLASTKSPDTDGGVNG